MASEQPQRSNLKSDLKFMAQTTYANNFVWTFVGPNRRKKEERTFACLPPVKLAHRMTSQEFIGPVLNIVLAPAI